MLSTFSNASWTLTIISKQNYYLWTIKSDFLNAEYLLEEMEIDTSTKADDNGSVIPTNPFQIVEMIRRYNSMNDATNPSDAIDDALDSFNSLEKK